MTTPLYLTYLEKSLVDDFFAMLNQQAQPTPPQLPAPKEPPRPYYAGPSPQKIERQRIEEQLRALVEASTARVYEMLMARLDEMKAQQIEAERQRREAEQRLMIEIRPAARVSPPPCTPSRNTWY